MKQISGYAFILTFLWLGFVGAISFMEAPVKFTAPSLTLAVGLDVGRHVFAALNKAEIMFAAGLSLSFLYRRPSGRVLLFAFSVIGILVLQTVWLLPALDARALVYIAGKVPPPSPLHWLYIIFEGFKLIGLLGLGLVQVGDFRRQLQQSQNRPEQSSYASADR